MEEGEAEPIKTVTDYAGRPCPWASERQYTSTGASMPLTRHSGVSLDIENYCTVSLFLYILGLLPEVVHYLLHRL